MTLSHKDRVFEVTNTTGTGNLLLGGPQSSFYTFFSSFGTGVTFGYQVSNPINGENEVGIGQVIDNGDGTYSLQRNSVERSSNSNALVNFSAGRKLVANVFLATEADAFVATVSTFNRVSKSANYTAAPNDLVLCDATSATFTITLPTAPADKTRICAKMVKTASSHVINVACGGSDVFNIAGGSTTGTLTLLFQAATYLYDATLAVWIVIADDIPLGQLDLRYAPLSTATLQGNTFNGTSQLVQTTAAGKLPALDGSLLTAFPSTVTVQGNTFNGASQLVQMTAAAKLPAVDGSLLTALPASPTFTSPTLGNAIATTLNKLTLTQPATGATLTIADGKTLTVNNTLTLSGTDGSTLNIGAGGTLGTLAFASTPLSVANGGTGQSTYTNGQLLIGNTTGNTLAKATLTGTSNQVTVTNGAGSITLSTPQNLHTGATVQFANVGVGTAPSFPLDVNSSLTDWGTKYAQRVIVTSNVTTTATNYLLAFDMDATGQTVASGQANNGYILGIRGQAYAGSAGLAGTQNAQYGVWGRAGISTATSGAIVTSAYGLYSEILNTQAGCTITNAYGLYVSNNNTTGTITNRWGAYVDTGSGGQNYFSGGVGIGNSGALSAKLEARATSGAQVSASYDATHRADQTVDSSGNLTLAAVGTNAGVNITTSGTGRVQFNGGAGLKSILRATGSISPGAITSGNTYTTTVTVSGATTSDAVYAVPIGSWAGCLCAFTAYVSGSNTVTIQIWNPSGGSQTPPNLTWAFEVHQF